MNKAGKHQQIEHIERIVDVITNSQGISSDSTDDLIRRSWLRCAKTHGLDPARPRTAQILSSTELREHQDRIDEFLSVARAGMEQLYKQVAPLGYILLLSDADGITVDYIAGSGREKELKEAGVYVGADWREDRMGTSGIGTAIAEKTALICHQGDHFNAQHIDLSCTAAPILDPRGDMLAVLNITAMTSPRGKDSQHLALQLTAMYAKLIEDANFIRRFGGQWVLRLDRTWSFAEVSGEMMLAFNDEGVIVGANTAARRDLSGGGRSPDWLIGRHLPEVFQCTMDDIWRAARSTILDMSLMTADSQNLYYISVRLPRRQRDLQIISQEKWLPSQLGPEDYAPLDALAGDDAAMQRTLSQAKRLVDRNVNILIQGETGSGKEVFARALHKSSRRSRKPFIALNCAAIPETLIESELFGYAPGSFTGGRSKGMKGLILQSDGGTLFLDEIGDMPVNLQTRLLRVLSEHEVMPLGGEKPIRVELTVIAASHRDLRTMIADGKFREDLYYRLSGATLHLPPLRERADLGFLIDALVRLESERLGLAASITPEALKALKSYAWPGNIRELSNVLRYALAISEDGKIRLGDLPEELQPAPGLDRLLPKELTAEEGSTNPWALPGEHGYGAEGDALLAVLRKNKWNVTVAAAELGVCRATIYRQMKKFRITPRRQVY